MRRLNAFPGFRALNNLILTVILGALCCLSCSGAVQQQDYIAQVPDSTQNPLFTKISVEDVLWAASYVVEASYFYSGPRTTMSEQISLIALHTLRNEASCGTDVNANIVSARLALTEGTLLGAFNGVCNGRDLLLLFGHRKALLFTSNGHLVAVGDQGNPQNVTRPCLSATCNLHNDFVRGVRSRAQKRLLSELRRTDPWFLILYLYALNTHRVSVFPTSQCSAMSFSCASSDAYFHLLKLRYSL